MFGTRNHFNYFQCNNCCCLQIESIPEDIARYYNSEYSPHVQYDGANFKELTGKLNKLVYSYSIFHRGLIQRFLELFIHRFAYSKLLSDLNVSRESKILDVGCGNGASFLYPLAEIGFERLLGCDPYLRDQLNYQNGLKILKSEVFSIENKWDFIFYHHSFEHMVNPKEHLIKIHSILEDSGLCILRIPTSSSYAWEYYRTDWYQLDAPRHFYLHSVKSIEILAQETDFHLSDVIYDSKYQQFMHSEEYKNNIPLNQKVKLDLITYLKRKRNKIKYKKMARALNAAKRGDQAIFILKKKKLVGLADRA